MGWGFPPSGAWACAGLILPLVLPWGGLWGGVTVGPITLTWLYLQSCQQGSTAQQNEHRLHNLDLQGPFHSLGALAVQLYQQLVRTAEKRLKPMIGMEGAWGDVGQGGSRGALVVVGSGAVWVGLGWVPRDGGAWGWVGLDSS